MDCVQLPWASYISANDSVFILQLFAWLEDWLCTVIPWYWHHVLEWSSGNEIQWYSCYLVLTACGTVITWYWHYVVHLLLGADSILWSCYLVLTACGIGATWYWQYVHIWYQEKMGGLDPSFPLVSKKTEIGQPRLPHYQKKIRSHILLHSDQLN